MSFILIVLQSQRKRGANPSIFCIRYFGVDVLENLQQPSNRKIVNSCATSMLQQDKAKICEQGLTRIQPSYSRYLNRSCGARTEASTQQFHKRISPPQTQLTPKCLASTPCSPSPLWRPSRSPPPALMLFRRAAVPRLDALTITSSKTTTGTSFPS